MKQPQRSCIVRGVHTVNTRRNLSDHEPQSLLCNLQKGVESTRKTKPRAVINWDMLREPGPRNQYESKVDQKLHNQQGEVDWKTDSFCV